MKRERKNKGFTLVEMLAVVLILVLVTSVIAVGVPVARRAYRRVTDQANAQVVMSTAMTCLRDELWAAKEISISGDGTVIYTDSYGRSGTISPEAVHTLIGVMAVLEGLRVTYADARFTDGVLTFDRLAVSRDEDELAAVPEFCIRVIAEK